MEIVRNERTFIFVVPHLKQHEPPFIITTNGFEQQATSLVCSEVSPLSIFSLLSNHYNNY